jgi:putative toxin-antitoxin system antitoxin component (TIGR02293 family)
MATLTISEPEVAFVPSLQFDLDSVELGVPLDAISSFAADSGVALRDVLEVVLPLRTLKHRRAKGQALSLDESDKLARLSRASRFALDVFGSSEKARKFLVTPKQRLAGRTPLSLLRTDTGGRLPSAILPFTLELPAESGSSRCGEGQSDREHATPLRSAVAGDPLERWTGLGKLRTRYNATKHPL